MAISCVYEYGNPNLKLWKLIVPTKIPGAIVMTLFTDVSSNTLLEGLDLTATLAHVLPQNALTYVGQLLVTDE
jgi:hypothetical protein